MSSAAFAVAVTVLSRVLVCSTASISVVDSTELGLQITASKIGQIHLSTKDTDGQQRLGHRARKLEVNTTTDGRGFMYRQWTCGRCSGISSDLVVMINDRLCYKPIGDSSYVCDGQRVSAGLVRAVEDGSCQETCSLLPRPLHCSERGLKSTQRIPPSYLCPTTVIFLVNARVCPCLVESQSQLQRPNKRVMHTTLHLRRQAFV